MSIQAETVPSGGSSGPGLSGLQPIAGSAAAVSQSPGEPTAQHHPHAHDPYAATYPAYTSLAVPYNPAAYNPEVNIPAYYAHDASQPPQESGHPSAHGHASRRDQHAAHAHAAANPHEAMSQDRTAVQQTAQELSPPEPGSLAASRTDVSYQDAPPQDQAAGQSFVEPTAGGAKRRYEDDTHLHRRQRQRMSVSTVHTDTEMESTKEDSDVGPSGGPKHWTDEEKAKLFHWLLDSDERWEAFGTKMNTVFREGSAQLFNSRKSFTALKSCYHRNLETFKQMYVFEGFLAGGHVDSPAQWDAHGPIASTSTSDAPTVSLDPSEVAASSIPPSFLSATERHVFLEHKLEAARNLNVPVSNLSVKVIDYWFDMGWFALFKRRFQEDPKTGLPVPRYAADREGEDDAEGEDVPDDPAHSAPGTVAVTAAEARRRHLDPMSTLIPPPLPNPMANSRSTASSQRSHRANTPPAIPSAGPSSTHYPNTSHYSHSPQASPQIPYGYPHPPISFYPAPAVAADYQSHQQHQQQQLHFQLQTAQSLSQLTDMTQTLLGTCNTLVELLRTQAEEIKTQTEILRRQEERAEHGDRPSPASISGSSTIMDNSTGANKAAAATEVLSNPRVTEDVKRAAADYLKRLFQ